MLLILSTSAIASKEWLNYSSPYPIRSAVRFGNGMLGATDGGILYCATDGKQVFTTVDGLETLAFFSVTKNNEGFPFAVSEYGLIAAMDRDYKHWTVLNRSFVSNGVRALPDQAVIAEKIMVIGFENRLAFFDLENKNFILTVNRLGKDLLSVNSIQDMAVRNDSLYVALESGMYARKMDWKNLAFDSKLVDPESWGKIPQSASTAIFPKAHGILAVSDKDSIDVRWTFDHGENGKIYVSAYDVYYYDGKKYKRLDEDLYVGEFYNVIPRAYGGVLMVSVEDILIASSGEKIDEMKKGWYGAGNVTEPYTQRLKTLSATASGDVFFHVWGHGFRLYSDWGHELEHEFRPSQNLCMDEIYDNYVVATSTAVAPDSSGFLTATAGQKGYSLVFVSLDGEMSCAGNLGSARIAGPITARLSEDGSEWVVYVGSRTSTNVDATGGLDVYHVSPPSKTGGRLVVNSYNTYTGIENSTPIDMKLDEKHKVLWVASNAALGYFEFDQDTIKQPKSMKGLQGATYTSIDVDVHGNVWVGTTNLGAYRLEKNGASFDSLTATRFTSRNGLLANDVSDLAIDPVLGMVWFTHAQGFSRYGRTDLRDASSFMTDSSRKDVVAYPNPFRPKIHGRLVIDNIAENATVAIYNRGGSLVRFFEGKDLLGGRVEWDGIAKNGKVVTPGVYYYVVKNSSETKKGKIIIIR